MSEVFTIHGAKIEPPPEHSEPEAVAAFLRGAGDMIANGTINPSRCILILSGEMATTVQPFNITLIEAIGVAAMVQAALVRAAS
jgi:hypothetical protein